MGSMLLLSANEGRLRKQVHHYRVIQEAIADLQAGRLAGVLGQASELEAGLGGTSLLAIGEAPFPAGSRTRWPIGLAVTSGNRALAEALTRALDQLKTDGRLAQIFARHGVAWRAP